MIFQPKTNLGGHPLILGRPWLATTGAYIGGRSGSMIISHGDEKKHIALYSPAQSTSLESVLEAQEKQQIKSNHTIILMTKWKTFASKKPLQV